MANCGNYLPWFWLIYLLNILPPGPTNLILARYNLNHILQAEDSFFSHSHGKLWKESVMKDEPEESRGVATHSKRLTQLISCLAVWFYYCPKTPILQNIHQSAIVQRTTELMRRRLTCQVWNWSDSGLIHYELRSIVEVLSKQIVSSLVIQRETRRLLSSWFTQEASRSK